MVDVVLHKKVHLMVDLMFLLEGHLSPVKGAPEDTAEEAFKDAPSDLHIDV